MTEEKETPVLVRIGVDLDEKLYIEFKKKATEDRKQMAVLLREFILAYLKK